ncbi:hypothetical protein [Flavobacterium sp. CF136]|uniref:hypothetical protein n=1 Tax=Flavobacterium sp. (strain CF136) TaxID=1144313 RepID=UPI00027152AF|nr:hypothetical protein [Flavobacterium sp. CF136]EJL63184.1 hypothetical protein PMI10_02486 [Flavobacterium sp. CF136]
MNKFFYKITFASILVSFLVNSCSTEDLKNEKNENIAAINKAEEYFNSNEVKLKDNIYFSGTPDWKNASFKNDTILVSLISDNPVSVKDINNWDKPLYFNSHLLIIKKKYDSTFDYNLKVYFSSDVMSLNINRYHLYDMENRLTSDNGKKPIKSKKSSITSKSNACELWGTFAVDRETGEERLLYTWWQCDGSGRTDEQAPPDGGGGGEGAPLSDAELIEDYINDAELDPCPKAILAELKIASNCDIANIFTKLGANTVYNLNIVSGDAGIKPAYTTRNSKNNYTTIINNEAYTSSTQLYKAANILHEITHAFFMSLVDDYDSSQNPAVFNEFPVLFQTYVDTKYPKNTENKHHEEMANTYVEAIGAALQEFQTGVAVPSGEKPDQIYTDLAWGGLRDAPIYEKKFPAETAERLRIDNRLASEQTGNTIGAGTAQQQIPIGKPCN